MPEKLCGLAHIGIYVADAEASKNFYLNTLRFDLKAEHELPNGTKLIFCDAGDCRIESETVSEMPGLLGGAKKIFLRGPDGERIELWEYTAK